MSRAADRTRRVLGCLVLLALLAFAWLLWQLRRRIAAALAARAAGRRPGRRGRPREACAVGRRPRW